MLDESFAEAWVNSTHHVLGLRLKPFSLWHRFQLEILESPILDSGKLVSALDLDRAVRACRVSYPEIVSVKLAPFRLRWRLAGRSFERELEKFGSYLSDYFSIPHFLPPLKTKYLPDTVNHPPPENMRIFSAVASLTGWPEEKIWMLPIGQAYWYASGYWYQSGAELDFLTPEHLLLQQRIASIRKKKDGQRSKS